MALGEDAPPLTINAGFSSVSRSSSENLGSPHTTRRANGLANRFGHRIGVSAAAIRAPLANRAAA